MLKHHMKFSDDILDTEAAHSDTGTTSYENIYYGDSGSNVSDIQQELASIASTQHRPDFNPGAIDGVFGPATLAAVKAFQAAIGMSATGVIDDSTQAALVAAVEASYGRIDFYTSVPTIGSSAASPASVLSSSSSPVASGSSAVQSGATSILSGVNWRTIALVGIAAMGIVLIATPKKSQ